MPHDVFVSHSVSDKATADAVCARLEGRGIRCWIAPRDVRPGADWAESIVDAIADARVMVLVLSAHANDSPQIKREVERAIAKNVIIIPFRIQEVVLSKALEYYISTAHWLDAMTPPLDRHLERLADTIAQIVGRDRTAPAQAMASPAAEPQPAPPAARRAVLFGAPVLALAGFLAWSMYGGPRDTASPDVPHAPVSEPGQQTPATAQPDPSGPRPGTTAGAPDGARVRQLQQRAAAEPLNAEVRAQLGNLYYDAERYGEALTWYEESLRIAPQNQDVRADFATTLYYTNQFDSALAQFDHVLRSNPGHTKALFNRGIALAFGKQDLDGAIRSWERVVQLAPASPEGQSARRAIDAARTRPGSGR